MKHQKQKKQHASQLALLIILSAITAYCAPHYEQHAKSAWFLPKILPERCPASPRLLLATSALTAFGNRMHLPGTLALLKEPPWRVLFVLFFCLNVSCLPTVCNCVWTTSFRIFWYWEDSTVLWKTENFNWSSTGFSFMKHCFNTILFNFHTYHETPKEKNVWRSCFTVGCYSVSYKTHLGCNPLLGGDEALDMRKENGQYQGYGRCFLP